MTAIPEFPKFRDITQDDIGALGLEALDKTVCEMSFANLIMWRDFDRPSVTLVEGNPCILISPKNERPFFLEPLLRTNLEAAVERCLDHAGRFSRVSDGFVSALDQKGLKISCMREHFDYVYSVSDLAELKGKKFDGKRNHIKKFKARHPDFSLVAVGRGLRADALALFEKWFEARSGSRFFPKLAHTAQKRPLRPLSICSVSFASWGRPSIQEAR